MSAKAMLIEPGAVRSLGVIAVPGTTIAHARTDLPALLAAVDAVVALHKPVPEECLIGDCAEECCDHEDECPTVEIDVCRECASIAEWANDYYTEQGISVVAYPCPTILALTDAMGVAG